MLDVGRVSNDRDGSVLMLDGGVEGTFTVCLRAAVDCAADDPVYCQVVGFQNSTQPPGGMRAGPYDFASMNEITYPSGSSR